MLRSIAVFAMQGRWQSAIATALLSLGALLFPPLSYLASGVIALSTLRMGPKEGAIVVVAVTLIVSLLAGLMLKQFYISGLFLLSSWLPVFGISLVLGYTRSLAAGLLAATGLGMVLVLGAHLAVTDLSLWWQQMIEPFMATVVKQPGWQLNQSETQSLILSLSGMMTGLIAAGFSLNVMLGLLIGRAWQAKLYNPGGFSSEFYQLTLGKPAAILTMAFMVITVSPLGETFGVLKDCLPVMLAVFALQGLAVVHAIVKQQQKHKVWVIAVYVLLFLVMPQMLALLAMTGVLEQWFNFRRRLNKQGE
jgi:uncharacterized protein YybS (DUF2232 family)